MIVVWWLPIWMLAPAISDALGYGNDAEAQHIVLVVIVVIQTAIGLMGVFLASKTVSQEIKSGPLRQAPARIWHILWTGQSTGQSASE